MKRQFIYGNWKMAQSLEGMKTFFSTLSSLRLSNTSLELAVFPSALHLPLALQSRGDFLIGGQDCSTEKEGAFTGEISAKSLGEISCDAVLIGHSERRKRLPETAETLKAKLSRALEVALKIVFCVGESESERISGDTLKILKSQLEVLKGFSLERLVVAYEPVWAIGTGKVASLHDIAEAHGFLRQEVGDQIPLLYGGSVNAKNAADILRVAHVNGVLVGGASLKAEDFKAIAQSSPFFAL